MPRRALPLILATGLLLMPAFAEAQRTATIRGAAQCRGCRVTIEQVASLGISRPEGQAQYPARVTRTGNGTYYLSPTFVPGTIAAFAPDGGFRGSAGQAGAGPGELREIHDVLVGSGDSLLVLHDQNQITVFDAGLEYRRTFKLQSSSLLRRVHRLHDGRFLAARTGTAGGADVPLRQFSASGEPGTPFGIESPFGQGRIYISLSVSGDTIWAADAQSYEIDIYSLSSGRLLGTLRRELSWFPPDPPRAPNGLTPMVLDIAYAGEGRMWVLLRRPRTDASAPRARAGTAPVAAARRAGVGNMRDAAEFILELLDIQSRRVVVTATLDARVAVRFMDGTLLYGYAEDQQTGELTMVVWKLGVRQPG